MSIMNMGLVHKCRTLCSRTVLLTRLIVEGVPNRCLITLCKQLTTQCSDSSIIRPASVQHSVKCHCSQKIETKPSPLVPELSHPTLVKRLTSIEDSLRYHGYSTIRIGLGILGISGICVYIFREYIRENVADEVSTVATRSLGDEAVKMKANELAMALLNEILDDNVLRTQAVKFLENVFSQRETQEALRKLLIDVLSNPHIQKEVTAMLKHIITRSLDDEQFREYLIRNLRELLRDPEVQAGGVELAKFAFQSDKTKDMAKAFFQDVLASDLVRNEAVTLGKTVVNSIVTDANVQQNTGDAMWSAVAYSMKPRWFRDPPPPPDK